MSLVKNNAKVETIMKNENAIRDLEIARRVQEALLEVEAPVLPGITIAKRCIPASHLGGDFYTFIGNSAEVLSQNTKTPGVLKYERTTQNYLGIAIGDVAGHGVSSALVMALSSGLLDKIGNNATSPASILEKANHDLFRFISNSGISHVTAFYAVLNCQTNQLTYAKAGHHPGLLLHEDGTYTELNTDGLFLGMFDGEKYEEKSIQLKKNDRLILYTDGILEAQNKSHEEYGLDRMINCLKDQRLETVETALFSLFNDVSEFTKHDEPKDDQTAVIIEIA